MARLLKVVLLLVAAISFALADNFVYSFQGTGGFSGTSFTFTSPDGPVTANLALGTGELDSFTGVFDDPNPFYKAVAFLPDFGGGVIPPVIEDAFSVTTLPGQQNFFYFADGAFSTPGVYNSELLPGNSATLTVRDVATSTVPEPFSVVLLGTIVGCMFMTRGVRKVRRGA